MTRYAIVSNGLVVNVATGDAEWAASVGAVQSDVAQIGWAYSKGVFTAPPAPEPPPPPRRYVAKLLVTDRLIAAGLAPNVIAAFEADPIAKLRWDSAVDLWADDPDVTVFLTMIGADPNLILAPPT